MFVSHNPALEARSWPLYIVFITIIWHTMKIYDVIELSEHWLRLGLVACQHQAITWTNVDLSVRSIDIHLRAISQKIHQSSDPVSDIKICFNISYLEFY